MRQGAVGETVAGIRDRKVNFLEVPSAGDLSGVKFLSQGQELAGRERTSCECCGLLSSFLSSLGMAK